MAENYFIYIIPYAFNESNTNSDPNVFGWEGRSNYKEYINFKKRINYNGNEWSIIHRKYEMNEELSSALFIIRCLNADYKSDDFIDSKNVLEKSLIGSGLYGIGLAYPSLLQLFNDNEELPTERNDSCYLFYENLDKNEFYCANKSTFYLKINYDPILSNEIREDIINLIFLSETAYHIGTRILSNEASEIQRKGIVEAFWVHKHHLLTGPIQQIFPKLVEYRMLVINNILDYNQMKLIENQMAIQHEQMAIQHEQMGIQHEQMDISKAQSNFLKDITEVEGGILYFTLLVSLDIIYKIIYEGLKNFLNFLDWQIMLISLIFAILISALLLVLIREHLAKSKSNEDVEQFPGYNDPIYETGKKR